MFIKNKILLFIFLPLSFTSSYSQIRRSIDSLETILRTKHNITDTSSFNLFHELADDYLEVNPKKSLELSFRERKFAFSLKSQPYIAISYNNIGNAYRQLGQTDSSIVYYFKSMALFEKINNLEGIATEYMNIGSVFINLKQYQNAENYLKKSVDLSKQFDYFKNTKLIFAYNALSSVYSETGKFKIADSINTESEKILEKTKDSVNLSWFYSNKANNYYNWASETADKSEKEKVIKKALLYQQKAVDLILKFGTPSDLAYAYGSLGATYIFLKKFPLSEKYYLMADSIYRKADDKANRKVIYEEMAELYAQQNKFDKAYRYQSLMITMKDSILNTESSNQVALLQTQFETKKKEQQITLQETEISNQKNFRNFLMVVVFMAIGIILFVYRTYRQKQKANELIAEQKALVDEKNKAITDSITYAKRLQQAILPPAKFIDLHLPENFVLYKPKDIVAGDFYWMEVVSQESDVLSVEKNSKVKNSPPNAADCELILIAAADCTGHGVPGAMVSVVCSNALNRAVKEFGIIEPGKILDKVRELVIETFVRKDSFGEKSENEVKDGMDISLCSINKKTLELKWAGANNPLWYYQDDVMKDITANKQPIGITDDPLPFTTNIIQLKKGEQIYLFTDGYADQFGGEKGKKFKYKQFQQLIVANKDKSMDEQKKILDETIEKWKSWPTPEGDERNLEQVDDILVMGIRI
jgi:serine phosphatase RsbU (regulator of sigma subunit)